MKIKVDSNLARTLEHFHGTVATKELQKFLEDRMYDDDYDCDCFDDDYPSPEEPCKKGRDGSFPFFKELTSSTISSEKVSADGILGNIKDLADSRAEIYSLLKTRVGINLCNNQKKIINCWKNLQLKKKIFIDFEQIKTISDKNGLFIFSEDIGGQGSEKNIILGNTENIFRVAFNYPMSDRVTRGREDIWDTALHLSFCGTIKGEEIFKEFLAKFFELGFKENNDETEENIIRVKHYFFGGQERLIERSIDTFYYSYNDIRGNYIPAVIEETNDVIDKVLAEEGLEGKVLIFHGPAGSGKTTLIQSVLGELDEKLSGYTFVVISSPHTFLTNPGYYYKVIARAPRVVFILEDVGDLLTVDNKGMRMEEVSNFLNLTDGILGKSRRDIFICTFNYDIGKLDKAVTRTGRRLANIEVPALNEAQAIDFLKKQKVSEAGGKLKELLQNKECQGKGMGLGQQSNGYILSDLFEIVREEKRKRK